MKYNYLIYYIRVDCGNVVGHGNECIELEHKITKDDIGMLYKELDQEAKDFFDSRVKQSKSIIANVIELG